jgi:hypothetical protein
LVKNKLPTICSSANTSNEGADEEAKKLMKNLSHERFALILLSGLVSGVT